MDVNKLRELAQKATPGPWRVGTPPPNGEQTIGTRLGLMVAVATTGAGVSSESNADFIAAANPAAILDLIDRLEAAEKDAKRYESFCAYLVSDRTDLDDAFVAANSKDEIDSVVDTNFIEET